MEVRFLKTAQIELDESFDFYEEQIEGLGHDFIREILATVKRIKNNPDAWTQLSDRTRRCLANRFPFGIIYQVRDNEPSHDNNLDTHEYDNKEVIIKIV